MPLIQASILEGRDQQQIDGFSKAVTEAACQHLNVKASQVRVVLNEVPAEHWYIGGVSRAEIDRQRDD